MLPPRPCSPENAGGFARNEEVTAGEHGVVTLPQVEGRLFDRRTRGDAGVGDDDVDAAERQRGLVVRVRDRGLVGHVEA